MKTVTIEPITAGVSPAQTTPVVQALSALAHGARLAVFRKLVVAGTDGLTPGVMAEQLDVAPNTLSHHLKTLVQADLVTKTRSGRHLVYRAAFDRMQSVLAYLSHNCCEGKPCELQP